MENRNWRGAPGAPGALRRGRSSAFLISIFVLSAFFSGCAEPGEPFERKPLVPSTIADLSAAQSANDVLLTFTLPERTADHRPLPETPAIRIYRDFVSAAAADLAHPAAPANPTLLVTIPAAMEARYTVQGHIHYPDSLLADDFAKHPDSVAIYTVRTSVSEKVSSAGSNVVAVRVFPAADAIADLHTEVTHAAIVLAWTPPQKTLTGSAISIAAYRIYRGDVQPNSTAAPDANPKVPMAKIAETQSPPFRDEQFEFGKTYVYSVRSVVDYPGEALESANSNLPIVAAKDTFAPSTPQGLVVVLVPVQGAAAASLDLSWAVNSETDIAGYNVYRSEQAGTQGTRLNTELLLTPAFRDMNVTSGHRYFYSVTAVDRSGNESPSSTAVSGDAPAQSQP